ncbi:hypothetical protein [Xylanivirga thermophila]|uniref:hypothetical protein n=1 Tax=Xylanivirga thermophila TaxID=2496273 RepID=UPI00101C6B50|nr:hypothetical protein [Xylanivirga thermophila]
MNNLRLLFKYATKTYKIKKKKATSGGFLGWILTIIILAAIALPMTLMFYEMFKMMAVPVSQFGLSYSGYLADVYMFLFPVTFGLMLILTLVPSIIFNVFESDDLTFLLSLPIKKWEVFVFKASVGLSGGFLPLLMLGISGICYAVALKLNIFLAVFGMLLLLVFIFLFSLTIGAIMTRFISKSTARIASQIFLYVSVIAYVIIMNVLPRQAENMEAIIEGFGSVFSVLEGKHAWLLPFNWGLYAVKGDIRVFGILGFLCIMLIFIVMKISNVTNMASGRSKTKKSYRMEISRYPIVKKEIRLIFRNPQNVFSISYAIIFPVVMAYVNKSAMSGAMFVGIFAAIYAANLALQLIAEEKKIWPMPKLLPIDMGRTLQYKAAIPAMIFTLGYGVVLLFSYFMLNMNPLMFLSIIPMTAVLLYSSLFGLSLFLNDPQRGMTGKTIAFKFKEALMLEFNTMLLAFGIIFPFNMLSEGGLLEVLMGEWWYKLIAIGLPWIIMVIVIFLVKRTFRKINMKVGAWE